MLKNGSEEKHDEAFLEKVKLVASKSGLTVDEILEKVKQYVNEMKGLVKPDGALSLIAAELGVRQVSREERSSYPIIKINKLVPGMRKATVRGKIVRMYGILRYVNRSGEPSERAEFKLADETGNIDVVVWSKNLVEKIRMGEVKEGDVVIVADGRVSERFGRIALHIDSGSDIEITPGGYEEIKVEEIRPINVRELYDRDGEIVDFKGTVVRIYPSSEFTRSDGSVGKRASFIVRDVQGDPARVILWGSRASLVEDLTEGTSIILRDVRVVFREDSLELHSTPRTSIEIIGEGDERVSHEGIVLYSFPLEEIGRSRRFLDLLIEVDGSIKILRVWGEWADVLKDQSPPYRLRFGPVYEEDEGVLAVSRSGEVEILEKLDRPISAEIEKLAKRMKYKRMWIGESSDGLREFRGTVIYISDMARVTWHCPHCGSRVEFEYGKFLCPNCGEIERAIPLLYFSFMIDDGTGLARVVAFRDKAEKVLGMSTDDVIKMADELGEPSHSIPTDRVADRLIGQEVIVRGRATYLESGMVKLILDEMIHLNPSEEIRSLIREIRHGWIGGGVIENHDG